MIEDKPGAVGEAETIVTETVVQVYCGLAANKPFVEVEVNGEPILYLPPDKARSIAAKIIAASDESESLVQGDLMKRRESWNPRGESKQP